MNFDFDLYAKLLCPNSSATDRVKRVEHMRRLIDRAETWERQHSEFPRSIGPVKRDLQIYKDEMILTAYTFMTLTCCGAVAFEKLLAIAFPEQNFNFKNVHLECPGLPNQETLSYAHASALDHPVKYVRDVTRQFPRIKREGNTWFDAIIQAKSPVTNDNVLVFVECKFTSDISPEVDYSDQRNQLCRSIDVGLATQGDDLTKFAFILLTPRRYQGTGQRFYEYKFKEYTNSPASLARDIPRLKDWPYAMLQDLSGRLSWVTWEDCLEISLHCSHLPPHTRQEFMDFHKDRRLMEDFERS